MDFKGDKIRSTPSFGGEVKPSKEPYEHEHDRCSSVKFSRHVSHPCFSYSAAGFANRCPWWSRQVARTRLIMGLITSHCIYVTIMKPVKEAKARSRAVVPLKKNLYLCEIMSILLLRFATFAFYRCM
jgi:hypothetical protein